MNVVRTQICQGPPTSADDPLIQAPVHAKADVPTLPSLMCEMLPPLAFAITPGHAVVGAAEAVAMGSQG